MEPAENMRAPARERGINVLDTVAEDLPYHNLRFDFVLMVSCISYFDKLHRAFKEACRVLKRGGTLIVGFVAKDSPISRFYEQRRPQSVFYKDAIFYSPEKVTAELEQAGFTGLSYSQTFFHELDVTKAVKMAEPGYGKGSFVVVKAL